jgi:hypothetical protein
MKKLSFLALAVFALSFYSCDVEPVDPAAIANAANNPGVGGNNGGSGSAITGTYILTAFNTSVPTDLNNDGTSSINQMSETNCLNNSLLTLNTNGTFTADTKGVEIDLNTTQLACFVDPDINGTWTLQGNTLRLSYTEGGVPYTDEYTVVGNTLVMFIEDGSIVGTTGGNPIYLNSDITFIYTKQ